MRMEVWQHELLYELDDSWRPMCCGFLRRFYCAWLNSQMCLYSDVPFKCCHINKCLLHLPLCIHA